MSSGEAIPLSMQQLRAELSQRCEDAGSQAAFCRKHGLVESQVSEAIHGKRDLSERMVVAIGYMQVTRYVPIKRQAVTG